MTKKELLDRCARDGAERVLLAVCWTSWNWLRTGASQPIPPFSRRVNRPLSPIYSTPGGSPAISFGVAFPAQSGPCAPSSPTGRMRTTSCWTQRDRWPHWRPAFPPGSELSHRDILGSLMGLGLTREKLGDILLPGDRTCQVILLREVLPILLSQWESAGRWRLKLREIPLASLSPGEAKVRLIRDTVATPRLDAVLAAGFSLSRSKAMAYISAGKAAVNHRECLKGDKLVDVGDILTCRGLGKCVVREIPGQSKKGRTMLVLERYI